MASNFDISSLYHLIAFYLHKFDSFHDVQKETRASNKTSSPSLGSKFNLEALIYHGTYNAFFIFHIKV